MEEEKSLLQKMFTPSRLYPIALLFVCYLVYKYRESKAAETTSEPNIEVADFSYSLSVNTVKGTTMGHISYTIKYVSDSMNYKPQIDSVLTEFNKVFSTYIPTSQISIVNNNDTVCGVSDDFKYVLSKSQEVAKNTNNYFDPTVMPLVNAWGFGYEKPESLPSDSLVASILVCTGIEKVILDSNCIIKTKPNVQLDFSAIAKGYASDVIADYLAFKGVNSSMVEIGGEVASRGRKKDGSNWRIGIEKPHKEEKQVVILAVSVENEGIATSGNYRNYITSEGKEYGHTINPHTGKVAETDMLSATVKAPTCLEADAYATAFMAMGATKSILLAKELNDLEVFFLYKEGQFVKQYQSEGFEE